MSTMNVISTDPRSNFAVLQVETKHSRFSTCALITYYDYLNRISLLTLSRQGPKYILAGSGDDKAIFCGRLHLLGS